MPKPRPSARKRGNPGHEHPDRSRHSGAGFHRFGSRARAHPRHRLADRASGGVGTRGPPVADRHPVFSGAIERAGGLDRDASLRRARHQYAGQPAAAGAWRRHRRRAGAGAGHRHGAEPLGPRGDRAAGGGDLSDPEKRDPAARAADLRAGRRLEDLHGGDRRILSGCHQLHHRRAGNKPHLSGRRSQLQGQSVGHVLDHRAARRPAGDHDGIQTRHRHRAYPDRDRRNDRRQKRPGLHDLDGLGDLLGRADVCRPVHGGDHRFRAVGRLERARARDHPLEAGLTGSRQPRRNSGCRSWSSAPA